MGSDVVRFSFYEPDGHFVNAEMPLETYLGYGLKGICAETFIISVKRTREPELKLLLKPDAEERYQKHLAVKAKRQETEPLVPADWNDQE